MHRLTTHNTKVMKNFTDKKKTKMGVDIVYGFRHVMYSGVLLSFHASIVNFIVTHSTFLVLSHRDEQKISRKLQRAGTRWVPVPGNPFCLYLAMNRGRRFRFGDRREKKIRFLFKNFWHRNILSFDNKTPS